MLVFIIFFCSSFQMQQFWEYTFHCRFDPSLKGQVETLCTGEEDLEMADMTDFLDVSELRPEYNIYKAVYALAYALDEMLKCKSGRGPFSGQSCADLQTLEPWQV